jgi:hypothetical protein
MELSTNSKLTLSTKALIRSVKSYACPVWEFAAETHLATNAKQGHLIRDMHVAFQVPYAYDYVTKLYRRQAEIIQNHENENVIIIGQGETPLRKYSRLKLGGGHMYDR